MNAQPFADLLATPLAWALNAALENSTAAQRDLAVLNGKVIALELKEFPFKLFFLAHDGRLAVHGDYHGDVDMRVRAPSLALLQAALRRDDVPPRGIEISGDAETAQVFSRLLKQADPDWEELLSRHIGDVAAHHLGTLARGARRWGRDAAQRLCGDLADYLHHETAVLPLRHEVDAFLADVDRLRDDMERFAARLARAAAGLRA
ncbi:MAG TPA: SCP2 sterol-binding domain-containing protein [Gammaproteobacteria bacterium]|nr:SCP2 sterol-binding domain-containing protein [Gammaproteobacteria bacterium]